MNAIKKYLPLIAALAGGVAAGFYVVPRIVATVAARKVPTAAKVGE